MIKTFFHPLNDKKNIADGEQKACSLFFCSCPVLQILKKDIYMDDVIIG
jgi:hypothetical protein